MPKLLSGSGLVRATLVALLAAGIAMQTGCGSTPETAETERGVQEQAEVIAEEPAAEQTTPGVGGETASGTPQAGAVGGHVAASADQGAAAAGTAGTAGEALPTQEAAPGEIAAEPVSAPAPDTDWTGTAQKWVPIFSLEREGARVGAAQVAGPTAQVARVKGVAELRLRFKDIGRIYAYIPVSEISLTRQKRVQGVSVWAIGDIELVDF
jgi:hypothetical protein